MLAGPVVVPTGTTRRAHRSGPAVIRWLCRPRVSPSWSPGRKSAPRGARATAVREVLAPYEGCSPERLPRGHSSPYGVNVGRGGIEKASVPRALEESYDAAVSAAVPVVSAGLCVFSVVLVIEDAFTLTS